MLTRRVLSWFKRVNDCCSAFGKTSTAVDYHYDPNGNLTRDFNKDIGTLTTDGIVYNHLNLPWQVSVRSATGTKGTITYIYDAAGTKLKKTTRDSVGNLQTVTIYIDAFQYQGRQTLTTGSTPSDTLQFIGDEEGRVRLVSDTTGGVAVNSFKYDYFLKDHLGNTRMVLTDEQETDQYPMASMEVGDSATENLYYTMLDETRTGVPPGYPTDTTTNPNQYVAELYSNGNNTVIGPGVVLKVMAGDQFSVRATSWYQLNGTTPGTPLNPLTDVVTALIAGVAAAPGEGAIGAALQANPAPLSPNVMQFLADTGANIINTKPHAFFNWVLFDNQFNYVSASSGFQQVGANGVLTPMTLMNLPITSSGYLYIYTSNATANVPVFFDNLQVTHTRGPLLEEDHYYPFGLTMAGISDKAIKTNYAENKYRYNKGSELQNKEFSDGSGLEMYETHLRELDPQLGRWWQVDSKTDQSYESVSPYSSMNDDPSRYNDPNGDEGGDPNSGGGNGPAPPLRSAVGVAIAIEVVGGGPADPVADFAAGLATGGAALAVAYSVTHIDPASANVTEYGTTQATDQASFDAAQNMMQPAQAPTMQLDAQGQQFVTDLNKSFTFQPKAPVAAKPNVASVAQAKSGSYTNTFESGKRYHGKGTADRAAKSAKRIENKHGDKLKHTDHTEADSDREGFKQESKRLKEDGGHKNPDNYNERDSPGTKYRKQDGEH